MLGIFLKIIFLFLSVESTLTNHSVHDNFIHDLSPLDKYQSLAIMILSIVFFISRFSTMGGFKQVNKTCYPRKTLTKILGTEF